MRAAVAQVVRQRDLRIARAAGLDAGGLAADRVAAVGADHEPRRQRCRRRELDGDAHRRSRRRSLRRRSGAAGRRRAARASSAASRCRFSILWPNASSPISAPRTRLLAAPGQPRGVIDDPHDPNRRGLVAAEVPDAERFQRRDRAGQSAVVRWSTAGVRGDQGGSTPASARQWRRSGPPGLRHDHDVYGSPLVGMNTSLARSAARQRAGGPETMIATPDLCRRNALSSSVADFMPWCCCKPSRTSNPKPPAVRLPRSH